MTAVNSIAGTMNPQDKRWRFAENPDSITDGHVSSSVRLTSAWNGCFPFSASRGRDPNELARCASHFSRLEPRALESPFALLPKIKFLILPSLGHGLPSPRGAGPVRISHEVPRTHVSAPEVKPQGARAPARRKQVLVRPLTVSVARDVTKSDRWRHDGRCV